MKIKNWDKHKEDPYLKAGLEVLKMLDVYGDT